MAGGGTVGHSNFLYLPINFRAITVKPVIFKHNRILRMTHYFCTNAFIVAVESDNKICPMCDTSGLVFTTLYIKHSNWLGKRNHIKSMSQHLCLINEASLCFHLYPYLLSPYLF